jgi:short-subunit dehydrogenase
MQIENAGILIAGATGELGSALARALSGVGAELALAGRDSGRLDALGEELGAPTAQFEAGSPASCRSAVDALAAALGGRLDAVVVAFGATTFGRAGDVDADVVDELFRVNTTGPMALIAAALPHMEDGGTVVGISAITADYPTAGLSHYSASKSALSAYLTALRHERRREGLRVLDVRPPHLDTGFADRALGDGELPRLPEPVLHGDVVDAVVSAMRDDRREVAWDLAAKDFSIA